MRKIYFRAIILLGDIGEKVAKNDSLVRMNRAILPLYNLSPFLTNNVFLKNIKNR